MMWKSFWNGVKEGKVGIGPITRFDSTGYKATLAAELKDFVAKDRMDRELQEEWSLFPSML